MEAYVRTQQGDQWDLIFNEVLRWKNRALDGDPSAEEHLKQLLGDLAAAEKDAADELYLLAVIALLAVAYFWQQHQFQKERQGLHAEIGLGRSELALANVAHSQHLTKAFDAYREDVQKLCQRIQAPELAVLEHQQDKVREPDSMPLTDEELAQQQADALVIAEMERLENEGLVA